MNLALAFDVLLAAALLWSAWRTLSTAQIDRAVVMFIVFGLLLTLAWARLAAPDIALAEAAIGAGLTGALLLDGLAALKRTDARRPARRTAGKVMVRIAVISVLGLLAGTLVTALISLPPAPIRLPAAVAGDLANSGVSHPVTAVLLNFRGYDTLLEVAVLLLALVGMLAVGLPPAHPGISRNSMLPTLARYALPLMVLAAVYLLWAGAHRPGGAFQAAAVLAAGGVLLNLSRLQAHWLPASRAPRLAIAGGFLLFLAIAAALLAHGGLLRYPPEQAGLLIVLIESGLTVSLAVNLAAFFLLRSTPENGQIPPATAPRESP